MSTFNPLVPTGLIQLNVDYKNIQLNFNQLNDTYAIDHVPLTEPSGVLPGGSGGAHKAVHMVQQVAPAANSNMGILYTTTNNDGINNAESLFYKNSLNQTTKLTRNFQPVATQNGATFLPGGLILNWGVVSSPVAGDNAITFTQPFANASSVFSVTLSLERNAANVDGVVIKSSSITASGFIAISPSGGSINIYWMAIGK